MTPKPCSICGKDKKLVFMHDTEPGMRGWRDRATRSAREDVGRGRMNGITALSRRGLPGATRWSGEFSGSTMPQGLSDLKVLVRVHAPPSRDIASNCQPDRQRSRDRTRRWSLD